jgi:hypothetical protein
MDRGLVKSENKRIYIFQRFVIRYCSSTISSPATCQVAIKEKCNHQQISWPKFTCYAPGIVSLSHREIDDIQQIDRCFSVLFLHCARKGYRHCSTRTKTPPHSTAYSRSYHRFEIQHLAGTEQKEELLMSFTCY